MNINYITYNKNNKIDISENESNAILDDNMLANDTDKSKYQIYSNNNCTIRSCYCINACYKSC